MTLGRALRRTLVTMRSAVLPVATHGGFAGHRLPRPLPAMLRPAPVPRPILELALKVPSMTPLGPGCVLDDRGRH